MDKKLVVRSKINRRRFAVAVATLPVVALISSTTDIAALKNRFIISTTSSMPIGIYAVTDKSVAKGSIVGACVPESFSTLAKERDYVGEGSLIVEDSQYSTQARLGAFLEFIPGFSRVDSRQIKKS